MNHSRIRFSSFNAFLLVDLVQATIDPQIQGYGTTFFSMEVFIIDNLRSVFCYVPGSLDVAFTVGIDFSCRT